VNEGEKMKSIDDNTKRFIIFQTLKDAKWNKAKAARKLGVSRPTLYRKISEYRIIVPKQFNGYDKITQALKETEGNKSKAAKKLGVSRPTLYRKISEYRID
jgi:transcriptional regulator of acetoin/glycerol metabolism